VILIAILEPEPAGRVQTTDVVVGVPDNGQVVVPQLTTTTEVEGKKLLPVNVMRGPPAVVVNGVTLDIDGAAYPKYELGDTCEICPAAFILTEMLEPYPWGVVNVICVC